ncbi:MAG: OmpH family outer membrane protein [Caulobacteraceae bacterium]
MRGRVSITVLAAAMAAAAGPALSQTAPAVTWGPPIAGVCLFGREQAVTTSTAGASAIRQLQTLTQTSTASLGPEQNAIKAEEQTLRGQAATLAPATLQQRAAALNQRVQNFQQTVKAKNKQLGDAQAAAVGKIEAEINTILPPLATSHRCSVVFERGTSYGSNPAMDLTPEVITQLNSRMPNVTVSLPAAAR